jgi:uncharacterized membrane-anchored protein YhcB (DUF1043 family)
MSPAAAFVLCACAFIVGINVGFIVAMLASKYWPVENANREAEGRAMRDAIEAMQGSDHG